MNICIFYFSRTGNSKRIAEKTAEKLDCSIAEITDNFTWKGIFGYLRGGFYSISGKTTQIKINPETDISRLDAVILVVPLWAGNAAPAGYSFLNKEINRIKELYVLIDNDGSEVDNAFRKLEARIGYINNKYGVTKHKKNENEVIKKLCADVKGK